jgi:fructose-1-phosphate kinase PfkB-like protein
LEYSDHNLKKVTSVLVHLANAIGVHFLVGGNQAEHLLKQLGKQRVLMRLVYLSKDVVLRININHELLTSHFKIKSQQLC